MLVNFSKMATKQTKQVASVRLRKPKAILLSFHGTISPVDWEEQVILPYVRGHLLCYLTENKESPDVSELIASLQQLSTGDQRKYALSSAPAIALLDAKSGNWETVLRTTYDYVMWQLSSSEKCHSPTMKLTRLCWESGYRKKALQTIIFLDVLPSIQQWKSMGIKVCLYCSMESELSRLVLSSTTVGDLASLIDYIFDYQNAGSRREEATYDKIACTLNLDKSNLLFMCNYGQDVKKASEVGLQVVLFCRPGNQKVRAYYKLRFPNATTMEEIEFV